MIELTQNKQYKMKSLGAVKEDEIVCPHCGSMPYEQDLNSIQENAQLRLKIDTLENEKDEIRKNYQQTMEQNLSEKDKTIAHLKSNYPYELVELPGRKEEVTRAEYYALSMLMWSVKKDNVFIDYELDTCGREEQSCQKRKHKVNSYQMSKKDHYGASLIPKGVNIHFEDSKIKILSIGSNGTIPDVFDMFTNLEEIALTNCKTIPVSIGNLENLEKLVIYESSINEIPFDISKMKNLRHLTISNYLSKELPEDLLNLKNLKKIIITCEDLSRQSKNILSKLKEKGIDTWRCG